MWILNFLPFWIFHVLLGISVLGLIVSYTLRSIPFVDAYQLSISVFSVFLLAISLYFQGAISNQKEWEAKVKEVEYKLALAEEREKNTNKTIKYKFIDRVKVVKDTQVVVQEKLKEVAPLIDSQCKLSPEVINLLNTAAVRPGVENKK